MSTRKQTQYIGDGPCTICGAAERTTVWSVCIDCHTRSVIKQSQARRRRHPMSDAPKAISREDAMALGLTFYFTGEPCLHGHVSERYVSGWTCVECRRKTDKASAEARRVV